MAKLVSNAYIYILCEVTNTYFSNSCGFQTSTFAVQGLNYITAVVISSAGANMSEVSTTHNSTVI